MYKLVTRRYLMMGAGQYLRDFRLAHRQVDCFNYPYRYFINMKYKTGNSRLKIPFKKRSLLITLAYYFGKLTTVHVFYCFIKESPGRRPWVGAGLFSSSQKLHDRAVSLDCRKTKTRVNTLANQRA